MAEIIMGIIIIEIRSMLVRLCFLLFVTSGTMALVPMETVTARDGTLAHIALRLES